MFKLVVAALVVVAAVVAYKLWKAGKAVTAGSVAAGVESDVELGTQAQIPTFSEQYRAYTAQK